MKKISVFVPYLAIAVIVTVIMGLIYLTVQQNYRSGADDPQLQIARDMHDRLERGVSVQRYMNDTVTLEKSLGVFAMLYNTNGEPIQSSGFLDGKFPRLRTGVLDFVRMNEEERVTWQPKPGVRIAAVVVHTKLPTIGYILVGRSLKEIEIREHNLMASVFTCWVIAMALIVLLAFIQLVERNKEFKK
jgi:hypothetical protein